MNRKRKNKLKKNKLKYMKLSELLRQFYFIVQFIPV